MSPIHYCLYFLFMFTWAHGGWTLPVSKSSVTVTRYQRVPDSTHFNFYRDVVSQYGSLNRVKVIPNAVPISHYHYEVIHPARRGGQGQVSGSMGFRFQSSNPQTPIRDRMQRPDTPPPVTEETTKNNTPPPSPLSDYAITFTPEIKKTRPVKHRPAHDSSIVFPEEDPFVFGQASRPSRPPPNSLPDVVVFPGEASYGQTQTRPKGPPPNLHTTHLTTTTTRTIENPTTMAGLEEDVELTKEFLEWISGMSATSGVKTTTETTTGISLRSSFSEFSLVNSGSLGLGCKASYRLDQHGHCRKRFG